MAYSVPDGLSLGLGAVRRLRSSSPIMAAIAAEISLCLEGLHSDLREAEHIMEEHTVVAAAFSRLTDGATVPHSLAQVQRVLAPDWQQAFRAWPWKMDMDALPAHRIL